MESAVLASQTRLLPWSAFLAFVIVGSMGCGQSGTSDAASPTAPSSSDASASSSQSSVVTPMGAPGGSYVATGEWHLTAKEGPNGPVIAEFDAVLSQDGQGTITFTGPDGEAFTLTRRGPGAGRMIAYELSVFAPIVLPNSPCETHLSGPAQLDTQANIITVHHFAGIEDDCEQISGVATFTKN